MEEIEKELEKLDKVPRLLAEVELEPLQGSRFQPTGFPDLGAAVYERPDGKRMILVESAQSMANRLEEVCLKNYSSTIELKEELSGIPYIVADLKGIFREEELNTQTSTLIEAHRFNSPFIISDKNLKDTFSKKINFMEGKPIFWEDVAKTLFYYDPNSLLHGVFFANFANGRIKVPRIISAFIEAENVREAISGGVKNSIIDPTGKLRTEEITEEVYSNVPFHRIEYTAEKIKAYFNIDISLIDRYNLDSSAKRLLLLLSLYKITSFLNTGLRLRTACDLKPVSKIKVTEPSDFTFPSYDDITSQLKKTIVECTTKGLFANPPVTRVTIKVKEIKDKEKDKEKDKRSGKSPDIQKNDDVSSSDQSED